MQYSKYKSWPKRIRQALLRFCIYGALLIAGEVAFYTITKIGRRIPFLKDFLFSYQWRVDESLKLNQIWNVPIITFYGQASLYMFFVYGLICVVGLEPAYRWMKKKGFPIVLRGIVYMFVILGMECLLGWILYWITGYKIWYYGGWGSFPVFTSFAIAPMWFICGLISENVINVFDSFDELKKKAYGLINISSEKRKNGRKVAVISDVHTGKRNSAFGSGWFKGKYLEYLNIYLSKIAYDGNISRLVIVGDFFDIWLTPPEMKPYANVGEIIEAWSDAIFMAPLKKCIELCSEVWYIPGNHDMGITQEDLNKLSVNGKTMILKSPGAYSTDCFFGKDKSKTKTLYFEHGHAADLFNAPVEEADIENSLNGLPFGYYITRLAADIDKFNLGKIYKEAYKGAIEKYMQMNQQNSKSIKSASSIELTSSNSNVIGKYFIELFVDIVVAMSNAKRSSDNKLTDDSEIKMLTEQKKVTISMVKQNYHYLLKKFQDLYKNPRDPDDPDKFHRYYILAATKNGLSDYAKEKFGKKKTSLWFKRWFTNEPAEKIVVMGHTHYYTKESVMNREISGIYVNTGCVCDCNKHRMPSWVEIINTNNGCNVKINN